MADAETLLGRDPTLGWRAEAERLRAENDRLRRMVRRTILGGFRNWTQWPAEERALMEEIIVGGDVDGPR